MTSREYTIKVGQELVEKSSNSFDEKKPADRWNSKTG